MTDKTNGTVTPKTTAPTTAAELMDIMGMTIARLIDGETTPAVANATVNSVGTMVRIVKLQLDYARITNTQPPAIPLLTTGEPKA